MKHDENDESLRLPSRAARGSQRATWRMIVATTFMSLLVFGVTSVALRATAQDAPAAESPPPAPPAAAPAADTPATVSKEEAPAEDPDLQEETTRRANPVESRDELPEDLRESADNNLSFPIDI